MKDYCSTLLISVCIQVCRCKGFHKTTVKPYILQFSSLPLPDFEDYKDIIRLTEPVVSLAANTIRTRRQHYTSVLQLKGPHCNRNWLRPARHCYLRRFIQSELVECGHLCRLSESSVGKADDWLCYRVQAGAQKDAGVLSILAG